MSCQGGRSSTPGRIHTGQVQRESGRTSVPQTSVSVDAALVFHTKWLEFTLYIPSLLQLGRAAGLVLSHGLWAE